MTKLDFFCPYCGAQAIVVEYLGPNMSEMRTCYCCRATHGGIRPTPYNERDGAMSPEIEALYREYHRQGGNE